MASIMLSSVSALTSDVDSLTTLRKESVEAAQEWWNDLAAPGPPGISDFGLYFPAVRALKDAKLDAATNKQERIKALTEYRDHLQSLYEKIDALFQVQAKGGEPERRAEARYQCYRQRFS
jgi:hypothetical protein